MIPYRVARVLYFSRSAFVLYNRTSSSREMVDIGICDQEEVALPSHITFGANLATVCVEAHLTMS